MTTKMDKYERIGTYVIFLSLLSYALSCNISLQGKNEENIRIIEVQNGLIRDYSELSIKYNELISVKDAIIELQDTLINK